MSLDFLPPNQVVSEGIRRCLIQTLNGTPCTCIRRQGAWQSVGIWRPGNENMLYFCLPNACKLFVQKPASICQTLTYRRHLTFLCNDGMLWQQFNLKVVIGSQLTTTFFYFTKLCKVSKVPLTTNSWTENDSDLRNWEILRMSLEEYLNTGTVREILLVAGPGSPMVVMLTAPQSGKYWSELKAKQLLWVCNFAEDAATLELDENPVYLNNNEWVQKERIRFCSAPIRLLMIGSSDI